MIDYILELCNDVIYSEKGLWYILLYTNYVISRYTDRFPLISCLHTDRCYVIHMSHVLMIMTVRCDVTFYGDLIVRSR